MLQPDFDDEDVSVGLNHRHFVRVADKGFGRVCVRVCTGVSNVVPHRLSRSRFAVQLARPRAAAPVRTALTGRIP